MVENGEVVEVVLVADFEEGPAADSVVGDLDEEDPVENGNIKIYKSILFSSRKTEIEREII